MSVYDQRDRKFIFNDGANEMAETVRTAEEVFINNIHMCFTFYVMAK